MRLDAQTLRPGPRARRANSVGRRSETTLPRMPAGPHLAGAGTFQGPVPPRHACIRILGRRRPEQADDMSDVAAVVKITLQRKRRGRLRGEAPDLDHVLV